MNDEPLLVQSLRGDKLKRPPIWIMRQAGRYLPEYREVRSKHSMLDVIRTPELSALVTLQPLKRFPLDAAIIFADILNPLMGLGFELTFEEGEGPKIHNKVSSYQDVEKMISPNVAESIGYTLTAEKIVGKEVHLANKALIGFAGAPFTLSYYLIDGGSGKGLAKLKRFMLHEERAFRLLQEKLAEMTIEYLSLQFEVGGVDVVQLFDSWAGELSPAMYESFVAPYVKHIITEVKSRNPLPFIYFAPGALGSYVSIGEYLCDGVGVDWRVSLKEAYKALGSVKVLQGNLDPAILFGPWEAVEKEANLVLENARELPGHIFNLGHGILPETPIDNVLRLVELVVNSS
jgi:uroporphyrinogen decarboxylase